MSPFYVLLFGGNCSSEAVLPKGGVLRPVLIEQYPKKVRPSCNMGVGFVVPPFVFSGSLALHVTTIHQRCREYR